MQRPPGEPIQHIRIKRFQIYDDNLRRWMNLDTCGQLQTYAQLYAFQDASSDLQSEIPPSSPPRTRISVPAASPQRQRSAHAPATLMDLKAGVQHSPHAAGLIRDAEQLRRAEPIPGESLLASERENEESRMRVCCSLFFPPHSLTHTRTLRLSFSSTSMRTVTLFVARPKAS